MTGTVFPDCSWLPCPWQYANEDESFVVVFFSPERYDLNQMQVISGKSREGLQGLVLPKLCG